MTPMEQWWYEPQRHGPWDNIVAVATQGHQTAYQEQGQGHVGEDGAAWSAETANGSTGSRQG